MSKLTIAAGVALALTAGSALAADLPSKKGPPPAYVPPPSFSWNGLYGGVNIGYGFGNGGNSTGSLVAPGILSASLWSVPHDLNGVTGGGQIGYNYQITPLFVVGVEADIQAADINTSGNAFVKGLFFADTTAVNASTSLDWWGTARGRLGVTLPGWTNFLVYGTGGFAYGQVESNVSAVNFPVPPAGSFQVGRGSFVDTRTGWTAGGGVEWSPASFPAWSVKVEYLYTDLGSINQSFTSVASTFGAGYLAQHNSSTQFHTVRAGLNWHFNPFGSAPVLAKF